MMTPKEKQKVLDMYRGGITMTQIAMDMGRTYSSVSTFLKSKGFIRESKRNRLQRWSLMEEMDLINKVNGTNYKVRI